MTNGSNYILKYDLEPNEPLTFSSVSLKALLIGKTKGITIPSAMYPTSKREEILLCGFTNLEPLEKLN